MENPASLEAWLRLTLTDGVGSETGRRLLGAFGLPGLVLRAGRAALEALVTPRVANALCKPPGAAMRTHIDATLAWAEAPGNAIVTLADAHYPRALLNIPDPPLLLYVRGNIALLEANALAVVGSRNATAQGLAHAERFSEQLSHAGLAIVSGLALGIDAAAHVGGLRGPGSTVAVIGTGIDIDYPPRNRALAQRIAQEGCIVSEYPLGMPPLAANFPRRNRLISGLARAVLVVEAAAQSGSLITARMAAEQGRDVFAIPGSIHSPLAKGCHQLIRQGAKLIETTQDILEEMPPLFAAKGNASLASPDWQRSQPAGAEGVGGAGNDDAATALVMQAMGHDPVGTDTLGARCKLDAAQLSAILLALELAGRIEVLPGARYRRLA
ncbi:MULTISPECIES: DNA-processing protein DprA [unclassified Herbaspirillum]|uniref:DNA-processing protein DprA n=1 Tax=unclassified Herbaspirillum TaxID=2624150 RepID=UPI001152F9E0|nr:MULTISPECIES: DNA-processing protein DprA [unclassified Herbaspirillum]MBB5389911.1 DNA processing protein [Herbaspirillum sp. SJZ102]TQK09578.1 DNA protecting protein DprA [Herbaspirillum sp. SJZ130]TQK13735.1 DNA protecting protein DprA [Herbaspirillum sp. SJZ106]